MISLTMKRDLLLLIVAYHSPLQEVEALKTCLTSLPMNIGYSLVVNDYKPGQSIEILFDDADYTIRNSSNNGYGKAVNQLLEALDYCPKYIGILNTDVLGSQIRLSQSFHILMAIMMFISLFLK